jgi:two-component system response regulator HydG
VTDPTKTISVAPDGLLTPIPEPSQSPALVIAWSAEEPHRVGEVALFAERGGTETLGRGEGDGEPRVRFLRQRPGRLTPGGPLAGGALSRRQLTLTPSRGGIEVARVGRCALQVNGVATEKVVVAPGDTVLLRGQLLLFCTRRVRSIAQSTYFRDESSGGFGEPDTVGLLGESPAMWRLRESVAFAANASRHVLLHGESGTGKELAARAVHELSTRRGKAFVSRNAATLPAGLIDAELFGNAKNYPNPGMAERSGLIGQADGGTLFLDEIAELPLEQQAHLLRVLDSDGEYQRLGDGVTRRSSFTLVAATNRDIASLKHDVAARFPLRVELPPLDARREDIPLLVRHLIVLAAAKSPQIAGRFLSLRPGGRTEPRVDPALVEALLLRTYETNVRELDGLLWRAMAASPGDAILFMEELRGEGYPKSRATDPDPEQIRVALKQAEGSVSAAARALGLKSRFVLYRLMKKHGIDGADAD